MPSVTSPFATAGACALATAILAAVSSPARLVAADSPTPYSCSNASQAECGAKGSHYCPQACAWNSTSARCDAVDNYPEPSNASLADLVGPKSPLVDGMTISFYGDSITWLDAYEPIISNAIATSPHTAHLNIRIINQGVNGGTIKDLVAGCVRRAVFCYCCFVCC